MMGESIRAWTRLAFAAAALLILSGSLWAAEVKSAAAAPEPRACIEVKTPEDLQGIGKKGHYCLANDIDMKGAQDFTPIAIFEGEFDGLGYTIRNLVSSDNGCGGLFDQLNGALIKNLKLINATKAYKKGGCSGVGLVAGIAKGTLIVNVYVSGRISDLSEDKLGVGGLVGSVKTYSSIIRVKTNVDVHTASVNGAAGGIVGLWEAGGMMRSSSAAGPVSSESAIALGGILGGGDVVIKECYATGAVSVATEARTKAFSADWLGWTTEFS